MLVGNLGEAAQAETVMTETVSAILRDRRVLATVAALAILAVLTGILSGISPNVTSDAKTVMHNALRDISTKGFGISNPTEVNFQKGSVIFKKEIIGNDIPVDASTLSITCDSKAAAICGTATTCSTGSKPISLDSSGVGASKINLCGGSKARMVVCGNQERTSAGPLYCIVFGLTNNDITATCSTLCDVK